MKNEKATNFWKPYFATKLPKEKFDILDSSSNKNSELEDTLTKDLLDFLNRAQYESDNPAFDSLDKITVCRICSTDVHNSLLYEQINSKKHRDTENYFIMKCMTYCDSCCVEIKNDEWRNHLISENHLSIHGQKFCDICGTVYSNGKELNHLESNTHQLNQIKLDFRS